MIIGVVFSMFYNFFYPPFAYRNPYPPVNISQFQQSLQTYPSFLLEAMNLVENFEKSPENMTLLMEAAQASQDNEVDRIVNQATGDFNVQTSYTPMSVTFTLTHDQSPCCRLTLNLSW